MKTKKEPVTNISSLYEPWLKGPTMRQWRRTGIRRRAGVAVPLFSIFSKDSIGIGELLDLELLVDWCSQTGLSIIQLLPMNDVGFDFTPYDAQSTFALDPLYLSLSSLEAVNLEPFQGPLKALKKAFPAGASRLDYRIKSEKLKLLWLMFQKNRKELPGPFHQFVRENTFWLRDYALFKTIKEEHEEKRWQDWPRELSSRDARGLKKFEQSHNDRILFHEWLQWQLARQFLRIKTYAESKALLIMGDLPFLVSRDSADVWSHQDYFKLNLSSGAPPDLYFAKGQRWGMPPYAWDNIAARHYDYIIQRLKFAERFYDLFRIDHVIGVFRLWTIPLTEPPENAGANGVFDPPDEADWEEHGKKLLQIMISNTRMLPCGEDLGTVPDCSYRVLSAFGIPGIDVQRWTRRWGTTYSFRAPEDYRPNSVAVVSTHDMTSLRGWWEHELGTVDEQLVRNTLQKRNIDFDKVKNIMFDTEHSAHGRLRWQRGLTETKLLQVLRLEKKKAADILDSYRAAHDEASQFWRYLGFSGAPSEKLTSQIVIRILEMLNQTTSIFSIPSFQDWLALDERMQEGDSWAFRINFPGTLSDKNWTLVFPYSLEELNRLPMNKTIRKIIQETSRCER